MNDALRDLFARDGHLTMLSLDRYDTGELDAPARRGLESHVEGCGHCRARLGEVISPRVTIAPRTDRSTGSATIAVLFGSAAVALAASTMVWLGASMWPSPHTAQHDPTESALVAGSYTSVAQEESAETSGLELELVSAPTVGIPRGETLSATAHGEGQLAIVVVRDALGEGDTEIVAVLAAPRPVIESPREGGVSLVLALPRRWSDDRIVAVFCPTTFTVEPGDALAPDPGCIARERGR